MPFIVARSATVSDKEITGAIEFMISCVNTRISFCQASVSASATTELYNRLRKASKAAFIEEDESKVPVQVKPGTWILIPVGANKANVIRRFKEKIGIKDKQE